MLCCFPVTIGVERQKKEEHKASGITIISDIEPFKSPIDGSMITTRSQRDAHFKQHNITDSRDYSSEFIAKRSRERDDRLLGRTPEDKQARVELIKRQLGRL